jgi:branched-chain amino acid transport system ATP-binding protein
MMTICGKPRAREGTITFDGRDITHLPTHEIARLFDRAGAGRPPHFSAHDGVRKPADGRDDRRSEPISTTISSACFALFPRLKERAHPARRHAVGRRAADAGDRAAR